MFYRSTSVSNWSFKADFPSTRFRLIRAKHNRRTPQVHLNTAQMWTVQTFLTFCSTSKLKEKSFKFMNGNWYCSIKTVARIQSNNSTIACHCWRENTWHLLLNNISESFYMACMETNIWFMKLVAMTHHQSKQRKQDRTLAQTPTATQISTESLNYRPIHHDTSDCVWGWM